MMPILEVNKLCKDFKGLHAVRDVSFAINENEILGMIGPNGSGKSTIFSLISGIYRPTGGSILFKGENITGQEPNLICKAGVGRTFQIVKPFLKLSALDNVIIGALNRTNSVTEAEEKARDILSKMGLENKSHIQGKDLSVPERKRLELARALATGPKLLLLDEVLAGLNPTELEEMIDVIKSIGKMRIAIFIVEHVMHAIMAISQRIMVLHHGEVIAIGNPEKVMRNNRVIEAYLGKEVSFA